MVRKKVERKPLVSAKMNLGWGSIENFDRGGNVVVASAPFVAASWEVVSASRPLAMASPEVVARCRSVVAGSGREV